MQPQVADLVHTWRAETGSGRPHRRRSSAALTAAAKWQVEGVSDPTRRWPACAPGSLRGVAHALLSLSRVAAAAKRIRVPDPCADLRKKLRRCVPQNRVQIRGSDRPAERHRSVSVTRHPRSRHRVAAGAPHATGVCRRGSRPSRTRLWSDTHARQASALPRRPVRAAGLTRVRLAPVWPLRDGRHDVAADVFSSAHVSGLLHRTIMRAILGETGVAAMKRSTNRRMSGSVCAGRPDTLGARAAFTSESDGVAGSGEATNEVPDLQSGLRTLYRTTTNDVGRTHQSCGYPGLDRRRTKTRIPTEGDTPTRRMDRRLER